VKAFPISENEYEAKNYIQHVVINSVYNHNILIIFHDKITILIGESAKGGIQYYTV
jgi:hypothetical protein